jgi:hypothetical protein
MKTESIKMHQMDLNSAKEAQALAEEKQALECFNKTVDTTQKLLLFCPDITETNEKL